MRPVNAFVKTAKPEKRTVEDREESAARLPTARPEAVDRSGSRGRSGRRPVPTPRPRWAKPGGPRLESPEGATEGRIFWPYLIGLSVIHLAALLALHPWFFSWIGLAAFVLGIYVFATLGINLGFHRLLTHRGLRVPKWLEHTLVTFGVCSLQNSPVRWVAVHRLHHQHSDERPDPHSPLVRFLWAHVGWVVVENRQLNSLSFYEHYARDVLRDPFYLRFERRNLWFWAALYPAIAYCVAGAVLGYFLSGTLLGGVQLGLSLVVWGVFARLVYSWHVTWSVNSLTHLWGYRNYETNENSRNNILVALLAAGEGWHNNHHADQRSAAHGHRWWEFDLTWLTIRALARLGLATDVVYPRFKTAGRATSPEDSPAE